MGVTAWAIIEDIALDASIDVEGRLVAETNVRRIAANLGLAPNTVTKHVGVLREHRFVLHEEQRDVGSGRYETSRYVLDPSACLERFTSHKAFNTPARKLRHGADRVAVPRDIVICDRTTRRRLVIKNQPRPTATPSRR